MLNLNVSHHMSKLIAIGLLMLVAIVVGILFWLSPSNTQNNQTTKNNSTLSHIENQPIEKATTPDLDISHVESLIQGFEIAPNGHLKITEKTRQILDVFLGDSSKTESNTMMSIVKDHIYKNMKEPAAMEAITLLEHYAAYKKALAEMDASQNTQQTSDDNLMAGAKMQRISALRNEYLSPEIVQGLYGNDDSNTQYELARQRIMSINGLSDEQRQEELTALKNQFQKTSATGQQNFL